MANSGAGRTNVLYDNPTSKAEGMADPRILIMLSARDNNNIRSAEELEQELKEMPIDSTEDFCEKAKVEIKGPIEDADGQTVQVCIPVKNESTFTPDGMTQSDPTLLKMYIVSRACEDIAKFLDAEDRETLTNDEIEYLKSTLVHLESADQGSEQ